MDTGQLLAAEDTSPLGRSRADVLDMLRTADGPLGVREVARRMGLHPNTARFHLEALTEAGLAVRETEDRQTPGRPRIGYRAVADGPAGRRRYRLLAEMLASLIAGTMPEPGKAAQEAGREWGAYLTEQPPPYQKPSADEAIGRLTETMEELGFAPRAVDGDAGVHHYRLGLRQCPFREVAEHHRDVICSLHMGLMLGALAQMRAPVTADRLEPFVEPSLCVAHLTGRNNRGLLPHAGSCPRPRRGAGGTVFPASARSRGTLTSSPDALRTVKQAASAASRTPSTSAISSPSPAGRRQRITTRLPTSAALSRTTMWYRMLPAISSARF